ncbi:hypothetical protein [Thioalkalivibrio sp. ALMg13-2]|uniref:hypothetical protein n=1 Tax=Thioalkalivibrio sp. ALMg13-2 TaxID=1158167 RepID=UPI0012DF236B|nr:hypothetical protein [Thioalkalivibrio sp. ALMg13-2]
MIEQLANFIPTSVMSRSGSVFYSGRSAFTGNRQLYLLGLNPGGSPELQSNETIQWHTERVLQEKPKEWSEYQDEKWLGKPAGTHGLQPRVLHLLGELNLLPRNVPASNVVFVRTAREQELKNEFVDLAEECWPFHAHVMRELNIKTVLCFGHTAGNWVREKIEASEPIGIFEERNKRKWKSRAFKNKDGISVVVATHPSIAAWNTPAANPVSLVRRALAC